MTSYKDSPANPCHHHVLPRMNRIAGQVTGIKSMIEEHRYCPDILTQLKAVRSALHAVEAEILQTHLESCVAAALKSGDENEIRHKMEEIKKIFRRFED